MMQRQMMQWTLIGVLCWSIQSHMLAYAQPDVLRGHVQSETHIQEPSPPIHDPGVVGLNFMIQPGRPPLITEIYPDTPAARQGLQPGDEVLKINSQPTSHLSREQVDLAISDIPGDVVQFVIQRHGRTHQVSLTVESLSTIRSQKIRSLYHTLWSR